MGNIEQTINTEIYDKEKLYDKEQINLEIERLVKSRLSNLSKNEKDVVYTLGIGVSYKEMVQLMSVYDESDECADDDYNLYIVKGSDERVDASGIVFTGADNEKMFFGLLGDIPTKRAHPLEDVNSISENQSWCVGKIEFDVENTQLKEEDGLSSLLRSCMICFLDGSKNKAVAEG